MKQREANYDLLRIISAIAVVMIHVTDFYKNAILDKSIFGELYLRNIGTTIIYVAIPRFAVPCFVMLSGAFILADDRNSDYKAFYKKSFRSVGVPTIIFSVIYFLFSMLLAALSVKSGAAPTELLTPIKQIFTGKPFYHMWYLYMLLVIYLITPIIIKFKNDIGEEKFEKVVWIYAPLAVTAMWTSEHLFMWDPGYAVGYLSFFMLGYVLRRRLSEKKNNTKAVLLILCGIITELIIGYFRYKKALAGEAYVYSPITQRSPFIGVASVLIFAGFSMLDIKADFGRASSLTFLIYLIHAGVNRAAFLLFREMSGFNADNRIVIPVGTVIVLAVTVILSLLYEKLWNAADRKFEITHKLCRLFRLE